MCVSITLSYTESTPSFWGKTVIWYNIMQAWGDGETWAFVCVHVSKHCVHLKNIHCIIMCVHVCTVGGVIVGVSLYFTSNIRHDSCIIIYYTKAIQITCGVQELCERKCWKTTSSRAIMVTVTVWLSLYQPVSHLTAALTVLLLLYVTTCYMHVWCGSLKWFSIDRIGIQV